MTSRLRYALMMMLLGSFLPASTARASNWSSIASACQPGVDSAGLYTFNVATFEFTGSSIGQIKTRCPVTNPVDSGVPAWTTLTVGYVDPDGTGTDYQVDAQLARTAKATGVTGIIKTFDSSAFSTATPTSKSVTFTHTFDFTNYAYFVSLTVLRGDTAQNPGVWYVQLK